MSTLPIPRAYPIPRQRQDDDPRLTSGLLIDVSDLLVLYGFPRPAGRDLPVLYVALDWFIYGEDA